MKYLVKYSPEMTIKSRPVRNRFAKQLRKNLAFLLRRINEDVIVNGNWDYIGIDFPELDEQSQAEAEQVLSSTQGICFYERVRQYGLKDLDDVLEKTRQTFQDRLNGKTFAVRCKRTGSHSFSSVDVEKYVGGGLNRQTGAKGVSLVNPQVLVKLEIMGDKFFVVESTFPGLNGFPLGTQDSVLSLISGGFDSSVSSYLSMRRGLLTHFCFFNLGGREHEIAVKEVALYLWMRFGSTHRVRFVTVPFEEVVGEILEKVDNSQMGVVLKRMMMRAAGSVADKLKIQALVTGESVAQVSSQTLPNLAVIDKVTDHLVFRPLAMMEKQEIVDTARAIGTEAFSAVIPEYCGVISVKPTTRARMHKIEKQEGRFDFSILDRAIANAETVLIDQVDIAAEKTAQELEIKSELSGEDVVIDIRHPDEEESRSLVNVPATVERIPFYKLNTVFPTLDKQKQYWLYCEKGIMSKLHASFLHDEGFGNVGVYRPER